MPPENEQAKTMSKEMKSRGFKFVGPSVCYSFMQAVGLVNDHLVWCFRYKQVKNIT
jgi:DNA-3-methyladenine glycosylase I